MTVLPSDLSLPEMTPSDFAAIAKAPFEIDSHTYWSPSVDADSEGIYVLAFLFAILTATAAALAGALHLLWQIAGVSLLGLLLAGRIKRKRITVARQGIRVRWSIRETSYAFHEVRSLHWSRGRYGRSACGVVVSFADGRTFILPLTGTAAAVAACVHSGANQSGVDTSAWLPPLSE